MKVLNLVLSNQAFQITGTPEKPYELREPTEWILSRIIDKNGNPKNYDVVEICNGYSKGREKKIFEFRGFVIAGWTEKIEFSNGLKWTIQPGHIIIKLGKEKIKDEVKEEVK
jgi:hypothetical protein